MNETDKHLQAPLGNFNTKDYKAKIKRKENRLPTKGKKSNWVLPSHWQQ